MKKELSQDSGYIQILSNPRTQNCVNTRRETSQPIDKAVKVSENTSAPIPFVTLRSIAQIFTSEELHLMIEAMYGKSLSTDLIGQHLPIFVADSMEFGLLHRCWMVNKDRLNYKLANLSISELSNLEIWIQGFWEQFSALGDAAVSSGKYIEYLIQDEERDKTRIASVKKQLVKEMICIIESHNEKNHNGCDKIKGGE